GRGGTDLAAVGLHGHHCVDPVAVAGLQRERAHPGAGGAVVEELTGQLVVAVPGELQGPCLADGGHPAPAVVTDRDGVAHRGAGGVVGDPAADPLVRPTTGGTGDRAGGVDGDAVIGVQG